MLRLFSVCVLAFLVNGCVSRGVLGAEDLLPLAVSYLEQHSTKDAEAKWLHVWERKAAQGITDNPALSEESFANTTLQDYLLGAMKRVTPDPQRLRIIWPFVLPQMKLADDVKLELCRWYVLYRTKCWSFPERVAGQLTTRNFEEFIAEKTPVVWVWE